MRQPSQLTAKNMGYPSRIMQTTKNASFDWRDLPLLRLDGHSDKFRNNSRIIIIIRVNENMQNVRKSSSSDKFND